MSEYWRRNGLPWLSDLSEADTEQLLRSGAWLVRARGELVFEPASHPRSVYLLQAGLVRIYRLSPAGAEATLGYVPPGEVFGELQAFSDLPRESFARAIRPSRVLQIAGAELRRVMDRYPHIALHVAEQMGRRFKRVERRVESLALHSLRARVCAMLLELAEDFGRGVDGTLSIDLPLSQQDLAALVGASRQSVNECLRDLREASWISVRNRRLVLLDGAAMRSQVDADAGA